MAARHGVELMVIGFSENYTMGWPSSDKLKTLVHIQSISGKGGGSYYKVLIEKIPGTTLEFFVFIIAVLGIFSIAETCIKH